MIFVPVLWCRCSELVFFPSRNVFVMRITLDTGKRSCLSPTVTLCSLRCHGVIPPSLTSRRVISQIAARSTRIPKSSSRRFIYTLSAVFRASYARILPPVISRRSYPRTVCGRSSSMPCKGVAPNWLAIFWPRFVNSLTAPQNRRSRKHFCRFSKRSVTLKCCLFNTTVVTLFLRTRRIATSDIMMTSAAYVTLLRSFFCSNLVVLRRSLPSLWLSQTWIHEPIALFGASDDAEQVSNFAHPLPWVVTFIFRWEHRCKIMTVLDRWGLDHGQLLCAF